MAKAAKNTKDKEMAAYLKKKGVKRTTGNCPMCHHTIPNGTIHPLGVCKPRRPSLGTKYRATA